MISIDEIDKTILELEQHDTTYATCEKLAWLYVIRDHLGGSNRSASVSAMSDNEFLSACSGVPIDILLSVLSEHMDVVAVIMPREYEALMEKIKNLS